MAEESRWRSGELKVGMKRPGPSWIPQSAPLLIHTEPTNDGYKTAQ